MLLATAKNTARDVQLIEWNFCMHAYAVLLTLFIFITAKTVVAQPIVPLGFSSR